MMVLYASGYRPRSRARRTIVETAWSRDTGSQTSSAAPRAEHAGPCDDTGKLAFPQDVFDSLATFAAGASASIESCPKRVRAGVPKDATAQQSSTVVSDRQQHGALLVIELGESKKLDAARLRVDRRRRGVLRANDMQIVHVEHEIALRPLGVVPKGSMSRGRRGPGEWGRVTREEGLGECIHRSLG